MVTFSMVPAARAVRFTAEARRARCTRRGAAAMALLHPSVEAARAAGAVAQQGAETANMALRGGPLCEREADGSRGDVCDSAGTRGKYGAARVAPRNESPSRRSVALCRALCALVSVHRLVVLDHPLHTQSAKQMHCHFAAPATCPAT